MNMDEYGKDLDALVYKHPWVKLKEVHKSIKIKEYVDALEYGKRANARDIAKNREYLKQELCEGLRAKKFNKNKNEITYDAENMTILNIACVDFDKRKGLYDVEWE